MNSRESWCEEAEEDKKAPSGEVRHRQAEILLSGWWWWWGNSHRKEKEGAVQAEYPGTDLRTKSRTLVP